MSDRPSGSWLVCLQRPLRFGRLTNGTRGWDNQPRKECKMICNSILDNLSDLSVRLQELEVG
jgi:hypothetical protein